MKAAPLKNSPQESHLRIIENTTKPKNKTFSKIYINTLTPGFSYRNNLGEIIIPADQLSYKMAKHVLTQIFIKKKLLIFPNNN